MSNYGLRVCSSVTVSAIVFFSNCAIQILKNRSQAPLFHFAPGTKSWRDAELDRWREQATGHSVAIERCDQRVLELRGRMTATGEVMDDTTRDGASGTSTEVLALEVQLNRAVAELAALREEHTQA